MQFAFYVITLESGIMGMARIMGVRGKFPDEK